MRGYYQRVADMLDLDRMGERLPGQRGDGGELVATEVPREAVENFCISALKTKELRSAMRTFTTVRHADL